MPCFKLFLGLIVVLFFFVVQAQIEMHGTDPANESLIDRNKDRRNAILKAFEHEKKVSQALKNIKGDRAEVAKICPLPSGWRPKKASVDNAKQWDIVPSGILSQTYPRKSGITTKDPKSDFESIGDVNIETCDFVTIKFKGDLVDTVDFSQCKELEITMDSYRPCHDLLRYLAEKTKSK